jgi:hypothetical protein
MQFRSLPIVRVDPTKFLQERDVSLERDQFFFNMQPIFYSPPKFGIAPLGRPRIAEGRPVPPGHRRQYADAPSGFGPRKHPKAAFDIKSIHHSRDVDAPVSVHVAAGSGQRL